MIGLLVSTSNHDDTQRRKAKTQQTKAHQQQETS